MLAEDGLQGPNDLVYAIDGSVYFSDLPKSRVYQITRQRSGVGGAPPKGEVRVVAETPAPNGVAFSPNQQQLYVADVKTSVVKVHDIASGRPTWCRTRLREPARGWFEDGRGRKCMDGCARWNLCPRFRRTGTRDHQNTGGS